MDYVLDRTSVTSLERDARVDLVERADKLVPILAANAACTEETRRISEENLAAIEHAELFSIMQPKRFGGLQVDFRTKLEVARERARVRFHRLRHRLDERLCLVHRTVGRAGTEGGVGRAPRQPHGRGVRVHGLVEPSNTRPYTSALISGLPTAWRPTTSSSRQTRCVGFGFSETR
ncbi:hypothetical protein [Amycolatopsis sp. NPDC051372]|uniref:hypothetical protein n=1 Tax=unclassified Amycolatopsis TaxID=2618356 RepID=UPI003423FAE9